MSSSPLLSPRVRWQLGPRSRRNASPPEEHPEKPLQYASKSISSRHFGGVAGADNKLPRYILGAWEVRGSNDWVRLLFYYHDVGFLERVYPYKDISSWERDIKSLPEEMQFPKLPYLVVLPNPGGSSPRTGGGAGSSPRGYVVRINYMLSVGSAELVGQRQDATSYVGRVSTSWGGVLRGLGGMYVGGGMSASWRSGLT